jgi:hypothetical protein
VLVFFLFLLMIGANEVHAQDNTPPDLAPIGDRSVNEGNLLTFTATASDDPGDTLTFSLDAGAPAPSGASIGSSTGVFSWTPTEAQGPDEFDVTIRVTDNGTPAFDDFETITVTVNEVNVAPILGTIGDRSVEQGALLTFTASATDGDLPANTLTFSLGPGAPSGAAINPSTGVFTWTPTQAQGPDDFDVEIRVTDNGTPTGVDSETITISVTEDNTAPVLAPIGS